MRTLAAAERSDGHRPSAWALSRAHVNTTAPLPPDPSHASHNALSGPAYRPHAAPQVPIQCAPTWCSSTRPGRTRSLPSWHPGTWQSYAQATASLWRASVPPWAPAARGRHTLPTPPSEVSSRGCVFTGCAFSCPPRNVHHPWAPYPTFTGTHVTFPWAPFVTQPSLNVFVCHSASGKPALSYRCRVTGTS